MHVTLVGCREAMHSGVCNALVATIIMRKSQKKL